jgi:Protein of unknown function (DUF2442)
MDWNKRGAYMFIQNAQYPNLVCVRAVKPLDGLHVHIVFTDGSERDIDLDPYLHGPLFEPIRRNPNLFASVFVDPDAETLTWPNGADIDPDVLYYNGTPPWAEEES